MFVDKMQFSVLMATGYESLPFTATQAEQEEEEAFAVKARVEQEAAKAEEALLVVKAGCRSKRKAEEDPEEEVVAFTVQAKTEEEVEDSDDDCDSDEEEEFMARLIADYNAHADKLRADHPGMKYEDYSTEKYAYMRRKPEEVEDDDCDKFEKLRAEYAYLFCKLKEEGSHGDGVDGLVRA